MSLKRRNNVELLSEPFFLLFVKMYRIHILISFFTFNFIQRKHEILCITVGWTQSKRCCFQNRLADFSNFKHVAEIPYENQLVMNTRDVDHGTVTYLDKIGFLQDNLLSAHTVWVNNTEVNFFLVVSVVHFENIFSYVQLFHQCSCFNTKIKNKIILSTFLLRIYFCLFCTDWRVP